MRFLNAINSLVFLLLFTALTYQSRAQQGGTGTGGNGFIPDPLFIITGPHFGDPNRNCGYACGGDVIYFDYMALLSPPNCPVWTLTDPAGNVLTSFTQPASSSSGCVDGGGVHEYTINTTGLDQGVYTVTMGSGINAPTATFTIIGNYPYTSPHTNYNLHATQVPNVSGTNNCNIISLNIQNYFPSPLPPCIDEVGHQPCTQTLQYNITGPNGSSNAVGSQTVWATDPFGGGAQGCSSIVTYDPTRPNTNIYNSITSLPTGVYDVDVWETNGNWQYCNPNSVNQYNFLAYAGPPVISVTGSGTGYCSTNPNPPSFTLTAAPTITLPTSSPQYTTTQIPWLGSYTYSWTSNPPSTIANSTSPNITVRPTATTTYRVTATDLNGCTGTASFTISVETNCCARLTANFDNQTLSSYVAANPSVLTPITGGYELSSAGATINGNFDIDQNLNLVLNSARVSINPGSVINVHAGSKLTIQNSSTLSACTNMWQGINVSDGGSIVVNNSSIADATTAITAVYASATSTTHLDVEGSTFIRNQIGIQLNGYANNTSNFTNNCIISGSKFQYDAAANPSSAHMLPPLVGTTPYAGVTCSNMGNWTIPPTSTYTDNLFDGLQCGIYSHYTSLNVVGNSFTHINQTAQACSWTAGCVNFRRFGCTLPPYLGTCIYIESYLETRPHFPHSFIRVPANTCTIWGTNMVSNPTAVGVSASTVNIDVSHANNINGINAGVELTACSYSTSNVNNNNISNANLGIVLNQNIGANVTVKQNTLAINTNTTSPSPCLSYFGGPNSTIYYKNIGIQLNETGTANSQTTNITQNTITGGNQGISLNYPNSGCSVISNYINWTSSATPVYSTQEGIWVNQGNGPTISDNTIYGPNPWYNTALPSTTASAFRTIGISLQGTSNYTMACNNINATGFGIQCIGPNPPLYDYSVYGNAMANNRHGLVFSQIGQQGSMDPTIGDPGNTCGNGFSGYFFNPSTGQWYLTTASVDQGVKAFNFLSPGTSQAITKLYIGASSPTFSTFGGFGFYANGTTQYTTAGYTTGSIFQSFANPSPTPTNWLVQCSVPAIGPIPYPAGVTWANGGPGITTGKGGGGAAALGLTSLVDQTASGSFPTSNFSTVSNYFYNRDLYAAAVASPGLLATDPTVVAFRQAKSVTSIGGFQAVTDALKVMVAGPDDSIVTAQITAATRLNTRVPAIAVHEINKKFVLGTYTQILSQGPESIDEPALNRLIGLAFSCPYIEGDAVYMARTLLPLYTHKPIAADDRDLCFRSRERMLTDDGDAEDMFPPSDWKTVLSEGSKLLVYIFPNPTDGNLSVVFTEPLDHDARIVVRDLLGQVVLDQPLPSGTSVYSVSLSGVENGTYIYQVSEPGSAAASGKVIKVSK